MTSAELSGRARGYRGIAIRCPGCAAAMRQLTLAEAEAEVDVCDDCGGLWVDWFDGEVRAIATETLHAAATAPRNSVAGSEGKAEERSSPALRNEAAAIGACPRCARQLARERYAVATQAASPPQGGGAAGHRGGGAELLRCEDCMGAFVSRSTAEVLASLSPRPPAQSGSEPAHASEPVANHGAGAAPPMPWDGLVALVKSLLGSK